MKYLLVSLCVFLTACECVPVKAPFPTPPEELMVPAPELKKL